MQEIEDKIYKFDINNLYLKITATDENSEVEIKIKEARRHLCRKSGRSAATGTASSRSKFGTFYHKLTKTYLNQHAHSQHLALVALKL
jgi:hypothetical protein